MEPITCFSCKKENVPIEQAHEINNTYYCADCSAKSAQSGPGSEGNPDNVLNDSVCAFCNTEHEGVILPKHSVYPICTSCKNNLEKSLFPLWVKLFFAGVLVLVLFSIFWNWRFFSAYYDIKRSNSSAVSAEMASQLMQQAAEKVPESKDVVNMASYLKAINFIQLEKNQEAITELEKCEGLPEETFHINQLRLQAEMGLGFDTKNYNLFLKAAQGTLQLDTTASQSWAGVASAYACLYAQTGKDSLKTLALQNLNKAKSIDSTSAEYKEYEGRIMYRIDTRKVIDKKEYDKLFPKGYTSTN